MPVKTWNTKADFDAVYDIGLEPQGHPNTRAEIRGNYERSALFNASVPYLDWVTPEWAALVAHFNWPLGASILIIGAGFGWAVEYLQGEGYTDAWGQDTSTWIATSRRPSLSSSRMLASGCSTVCARSGGSWFSR